METVLLTLVVFCNIIQFCFWMKTFTLKKANEFVTEIINNFGIGKTYELVRIIDEWRYKAREEIVELVKENERLKSDIEMLKSENKTMSQEYDGLIKRLVYLEQKPETPLPKPLKGGKRSR